MSVFAVLTAVWSVPIAAALLVPLVSLFYGRPRGFLPIAAGFATAAIAACLAAAGWSGAETVAWVRLPVIGVVSFGYRLDPLSLLFVNLVAWISLAVFLYSLGYMRGDPGLTRYWVLMLVFLGSMELLVLADNLLLLFFCWEIVGTCSFLLISYWYTDDERLRRIQWVGEPPEEYPPSHCGLKAFLTTRVSDSFLLASLVVIALRLGTLSLSELMEKSPGSNDAMLSVALLLAAVGAMGKSAQLPFMEWLPDAMAGPSSVSALIHAATMVKAGVYLISRLSQLALAWGPTIDVRPFFYYVAWTGMVTSIIAALQAGVASELKKTLAYSTASQLGYMVGALGMCYAAGQSAISAAMAHVISHGLYKSALFLAAGVVVHHAGSRFYREMFGVARELKLTLLSLVLSALSLIGVPPFAGYWSKDQILSVLAYSLPLYALGLFSAALTAFYTTRMLLILLKTDRRFTAVRKSHHDAEQLVPLVLSVSGLCLGLASSATFRGVNVEHLSAIAPLASSAVGAAVALFARSGGALGGLLQKVAELLKRRLYLNKLYYWVSACVLAAAKSVQRLEDAYNSSLEVVSRGILGTSNRVAKLEVGEIGVRELLWILVLLALLLIALTIR